MSCGDGKCPELIVNAVLKRVEVGKISRKLQTRLAFAQFKVEHGLEDLPFDTIEPRMKELQDVNDHSSSNSDTISFGSSPYEVDKNRRCFMGSSGKGSAVFSDQFEIMNIRGSSSHGKRHCNLSFEDCSYKVCSWKRHCSSPLISRITPAQGRNQALSSPVMGHKHHHFMSDSWPSLPLFAEPCRKSFIMRCDRYMVETDKEEDELPPHPSDFKSSPPSPCTPSTRHFNDNLNCRRYQNAEKPRKDGGHDAQSLFKHLSMSPSLRKTPGAIRHLPSTPPPRTPTPPSSVMSTIRGTCDIFSSETDPHTPLQAFDFSDFVNITPSPSRLFMGRSTTDREKK
ncbi:hypothetical protein EPUL_005309 [Erysiphe pulchra]|uniref:Uncharacterized protein n=1 Tax=Erysiphe pulchra TaxID=225359 RepID=A0A2S4PQJ2_9PEZI|nr:hypothetical protein EPUL_005309 [Erysiphe pulchra]